MVARTGTRPKAVCALAFPVSAALLWAAWWKVFPFSLTEVLGFVTGAWCVWLLVEQNVWNWPVGIANNLFYISVLL